TTTVVDTETSTVRNAETMTAIGADGSDIFFPPSAVSVATISGSLCTGMTAVKVARPLTSVLTVMVNGFQSNGWSSGRQSSLRCGLKANTHVTNAGDGIFSVLDIESGSRNASVSTGAFGAP